MYWLLDKITNDKIYLLGRFIKKLQVCSIPGMFLSVNLATTLLHVYMYNKSSLSEKIYTGMSNWKLMELNKKFLWYSVWKVRINNVSILLYTRLQVPFTHSSLESLLTPASLSSIIASRSWLPWFGLQCSFANNLPPSVLSSLLSLALPLCVGKN